MKTLKFKIHSFIDLITNSSTENSVEPLKEMINEMFKICGIEKTCDDVLVIELDNEYDNEMPSTLNIHAIESKYDYLVTLIEKFLNSIEEFMN